MVVQLAAESGALLASDDAPRFLVKWKSTYTCRTTIARAPSLKGFVLGYNWAVTTRVCRLVIQRGDVGTGAGPGRRGHCRLVQVRPCAAGGDAIFARQPMKHAVCNPLLLVSVAVSASSIPSFSLVAVATDHRLVPSPWPSRTLPTTFRRLCTRCRHCTRTAAHCVITKSRA